MKSVTIFADFRDYDFFNRYQTIKTVRLVLGHIGMMTEFADF